MLITIVFWTSRTVDHQKQTFDLIKTCFFVLIIFVVWQKDPFFITRPDICFSVGFLAF